MTFTKYTEMFINIDWIFNIYIIDFQQLMQERSRENRLHLVLIDLIDGIKQIDIGKKYGYSKSYISLTNKRLNQLKYKPKIKDNKVVCLECNREDSLCIHHNHKTGQPIAILCHKCNRKAGNRVIFENGELSHNEFESNLFPKNTKSIRLNDDMFEKAFEIWNEKYPYAKTDAYKKVVENIVTEFIRNNNNKKVNKNGQKNTS